MNETEQRIIGALLLNPASITEAKDTLSPDEMQDSRHQTVLDTIYSIIDNGDTFDIHSLLAELQRQGKANHGLPEYLLKLFKLTTTSAGLTMHIQELKESNRRREVSTSLIQGAEKIKKGTPIDEALADLQVITPSETKDTDKASILDFPAHIITGAAGNFADIFSHTMEAPAHFFFISYLTCLGSVLAGHITLKSELTPQPRLYILILGESADDRKSTAINKTIEFFKMALTDFRACFGVNSAEGLQKRFTKDENLLLVYDEFKSFVGKTKIEGSVLLPCVCSLFEMNSYESHTKKDDIELERAFLSMLSASTIQTYERTWDTAFTDIGMTNRIFIVPGETKKQYPIPQQMNLDTRDTLKSELAAILRHASLIPQLDITPEAMALYKGWYLNLEQSVHAKRLDTYAMRFMILLAVNSRKTIIDEQIIQDVITLMSWQLEVRRLYDPVDADNAIAKIEEKIRRVLKTGPRSDRDLKRAVHYNRVGVWIFSTAIKNLLNSKEVHYQKKDRTWRLK
jgi:hypothetical protein